eukprot:s5332_g2.t1
MNQADAPQPPIDYAEQEEDTIRVKSLPDMVFPNPPDNAGQARGYINQEPPPDPEDPNDPSEPEEEEGEWVEEEEEEEPAEEDQVLEEEAEPRSPQQEPEFPDFSSPRSRLPQVYPVAALSFSLLILDTLKLE